MKRIAAVLFRWLTGLFLGLVTAGVLFVLTALLVGTDALGGVFELMLTAFAVVVFPFVFVLGTTAPRQVVRRGLFTLALEGFALLVESVLLLSGARVVDAQQGSWVKAMQSMGENVAQVSPAIVGLGGLALLALSAYLFRSASSRRARPEPAVTAIPSPTSADFAEPIPLRRTSPVDSSPTADTIANPAPLNRNSVAWRLGAATRHVLTNVKPKSD